MEFGVLGLNQPVYFEVHKHTSVDLAHFGGHARRILPPLSPSQSIIADFEQIICWGTLPKFCVFFAFCDVYFLVPPVLSFFCSFVSPATSKYCSN